LRAQDGMLITTEARGNAANHAKDMGETTQRLKAAQDQHDALAEAAQVHKAQEQGFDQDTVQKALKAQNDAIQGKEGQGEDGRFPELNEPHLVLASPAGIEASTPGTIHLHTGEHAAFTSQGHTSISTAKRWLASAVEGIRAFTHKKGIKLIASEDPIEIQAHRDELILVAHKDVVIKSVEGELHITAKKKVVIIGGGSYSEWSESGIKHGTAGTWQEHAALHAQVGPMNKAPALPELPVQPSDYSVKYQFADRHTGLRLAQHRYELREEDGAVHTGITDLDGWANLVQTSGMRLVKAWVAEFPVDMDDLSRSTLI
ncbi:DUF2345 domain-containing protein, partial [Variovorax boronicumulans]